MSAWGVDPLAMSALGWAIVHFVWQGGVIVGLTGLALAGLRPAGVRYAVACVGLGCAATTFIVTWVLELMSGPAPGGVTAALPAVGPSLGIFIPTTAWLWCVGVALLMTRVGAQWLAARRIRTTATADIDVGLGHTFEALCARLGVRRGVRLLRSGLGEVPMVIGWLSPVVILPVAALARLTPEQLRAVLAHELAHVRRFDDLINGLQTAVEILLFFHPAVWWLSGQVRCAREQCCDDIAVRSVGDPLVYARALSCLEGLRAEPAALAVAANGGRLMDRIERIAGLHRPARRAGGGPRAAACAMVGLALTTVGLVHAAARTEPQVTPEAAALRAAVDGGEITLDEAYAEFFDDIFPGSPLALKMDTALQAVESELDAGVAAGEISVEDAEHKLAWRRRENDRQADIAFAMAVRGLSRDDAYFEVINAEIDAAEDEGTLDADAAQRRRQAVQRELEMRARRRAHLDQVAAKLHEEVRSGRISAEEARTKLGEVEAGLASKTTLHQLEREIRAAVEAGLMTDDEAREKLEAVEQKMLEADRRREVELKRRIDEAALTRAESAAASAESAARQARLRAVEIEDLRAKLEAAVEQGHLTRAEADRRIAEITARLEERRPPGDR